MKKLMHIIMLDCNEATQLISIKRYKKLSLIKSIQLSMHLMACNFCKQFSRFNDSIDESMNYVCSNLVTEGDKLSDKKKHELEILIEDANK